jgi:hypothetical protein
MNKAKALKTAKEWLFPALMYAIYDCSDSMHEAEQLEARFGAYVDDKISIKEFVRKNLRKEFVTECVNALEQCGHAHSEWREYFNDTPSGMAFDFKDIEPDLEKAFS